MKAAIFDMDGTLLDSMGMWRNILPDYLKKLNISTDIDLNALVENMSFVDAAAFVSKELNLGKTPEEIYGEIEDYIVYQYENTIILKPHVEDYLKQLQQEGIPMCVATLTDKYMAKLVLERLNIDTYFTFVLTVGEVGKSKEYPDIYLECAKRFSLNIKDCVVFEDAPYALKTAKKAGFPCYGVSDPNQHFSKDFIEKYCDIFLKGYEELLK